MPKFEVDDSRAKFRTWLSRIIRSTVIDHLRSQGRDKYSDVRDESGNIPEYCFPLAESELQQLIELDADTNVIARQRAINHNWQTALESEVALQALYLVESFRSNVLDLLDDLHGQSCTPYTLKKADLPLDLLAEHFDLLSARDAFFFGDELLSKSELVVKYSQLRKDAERYQLNMTG